LLSGCLPAPLIIALFVLGAKEASPDRKEGRVL